MVMVNMMMLMMMVAMMQVMAGAVISIMITMFFTFECVPGGYPWRGTVVSHLSPESLWSSEDLSSLLSRPLSQALEGEVRGLTEPARLCGGRRAVLNLNCQGVVVFVVALSPPKYHVGEFACRRIAFRSIVSCMSCSNMSSTR